MFRRGVAKSVEALSKMAIKRACKFALKKKLGHLILGDIDLDQLDIQLFQGLILLSDLALNVDPLNLKLSETSIFRVREGSIGSLSVKLPWNAGAFEIEIHDLELVLFPLSTPPHHSPPAPAKPPPPPPPPPASSNVHQGVQTVAKWLQQLLTRFHLKINNVILAFHTSLTEPASHHALVLRAAQIECGTSISDDNSNSNNNNNTQHLSTFLNFQGTTVDLLQTTPDFVPILSASAPSQTLLTGDKAGFGGTLKLSIPYKDGSLDIRKVDADIKMDRLLAHIHPTTLKWILATWDMFQTLDTMSATVSHMPSDAHFSSSIPSRNKTAQVENPTDFGEPFREKTVTDVFLNESQFISDWIPFSSSDHQSEGYEDADLGASVDQFFECLDGMRSSQSALGSSGVWSWTNSVFSAITAASNLASGSSNMSAEQQHVQTNLKINVVGVSSIFSFLDEDSNNSTGKRLDSDPYVHHLGSIWEDIFVAVQVFPENWKLETSVNHVVLNEYMCRKVDPVDVMLHDHNGQTLVIRDLQEKVQRSLPYSSFGEETNEKNSGGVSKLEAASRFWHPANCGCNGDIVTTTFFETSGSSHCLFAASSGSPDVCSTRRASLSLKLPPFVFWLSSDVVHLVLDFVRNFDDFPRKCRSRTDFSSGSLKEQASNRPSVSSNQHTASASYRGGLEGSVDLPHGRVILCFPFSKDRGSRTCTSWNEFIALDFSSPSLMKLTTEAPARENIHRKRGSPSPSHAMDLNVVNLDVYYISSLEDDDRVDLENRNFCACRVLSLGNRTDWICLISMIWREDALTGAWIKKSAKLFATSDDSAHKVSSSGLEFASVSSWEHGNDLSSLKEKLLLSSKFCLHICVPSTVVTLSRSQYLCLLDLVNQAVNVFVVSEDKDHENPKTAINQTSILFECGLVEIHLDLGQGDCPKSSLQRELPGSWHSLRMEVHNLDVLHTSDIGAVSGARFLWLSHHEGKLWGSFSVGADQDFMLISFSDRSNGRGDGEGSNVLSCGPAGSKFVHMSDPESSHDFMSIVLKCGTIVAPGGRLDWFDKLSSFFSFPSPSVGVSAGCTLEKEDSKGLSFVIKLLDAALSYEPYFRNPEINEDYVCSSSEFYVSSKDKSHDNLVACLLAVSALMLSNTTVADGLDDNYSITLQDVGLLLHDLSRLENHLGEYSAGCLREIGYVKVAGESLITAILKINYEDDISWELQCSETNIVLHTCHDTTFGLIRLASQLQQLYAPDVEESLVHLQNRWNFFQEVQGEDNQQGSSETSSSCSPRRFQSQQLVPDSTDKYELAGLMGEICEDAFLLSEKCVGRSSDARPESFLEFSHKGEITEGCCLSGVRSLSELAINSHFGEEISKSYLVNRGSVDLQDENSGWYGRTPLRIVENYAADRTKRTYSKQFTECQQYDKERSGSQLCKGRVLLKNAQVKWQMYAGYDWPERGKSQKMRGRDGSVCLELALLNMSIQYDIFPDRNICSSKLSLSVQDFHLSDQSRNAPWKLVLGYYHSKEHPRESLSKALKFDLEAVRPNPVTPLEEYRLHIGLLPLLLHLHQSQLDFLVAFFGNNRPSVEQQGDSDDSGLLNLRSGGDNKLIDGGITEEALLPFFQKFDVWPIVVRVDYCPSRVDLAALSSGKYVELVNLVQWKGVVLQLKHVQAAGVYGWSNVCETALGEWLEDISQNQIHKLLRGLPTIRSFVAVSSGAAKLLSLPVKNYRKDYKLVKGLQRGTISFLRSISVEALGLGVHLVAGAHEILLHAECILTRMQPSVPRPVRSKLKLSRGTEQPQDAQRGLKQARDSLSSGFGKSASAVIHNPMKTYRRDGNAGSALVTAFKGAPAAAIAPASAAAQALHFALVGVRNSLDPVHKEESLNKYLGPYHSSKC